MVLKSEEGRVKSEVFQLLCFYLWKFTILCGWCIKKCHIICKIWDRVSYDMRFILRVYYKTHYLLVLHTTRGISNLATKKGGKNVEIVWVLFCRKFGYPFTQMSYPRVFNLLLSFQKHPEFIGIIFIESVKDTIFIMNLTFCWLFGFLLFPDRASCRGDHKGIGKNGLWSDDIGWCWAICLQLCVLSFLVLRRAEWNQITICTCAPLLYYRRGDSNAICCFIAGSTGHIIQVLITCSFLEQYLYIVSMVMSCLCSRLTKSSCFLCSNWF